MKMTKQMILIATLTLFILLSWANGQEAQAHLLIETLPRGCPGCTDLTVDSFGNPVVIYFDGATEALLLFACNNAMCSNFDATILPVSPSGKQESALPRGCPGCLAMEINPLNQVIITFYDSLNGELNLITCADTSCADPNIITIDQEGDAGQGNDVAVMEDGSAVVSYSNAVGDVLLAVCTLEACQRTVIESSSLKAGENSLPRGCPGCTALALNNDGYAVIQYFDRLTGDPRLAICPDALCTDPDLVTIDVGTGLAPANNFLPRDCPGCSDLALANGQNPVITYYDDVLGDLRLILCQDAVCSGFMLLTLDGVGDTGQDVSLALNEQQHPVISYYDVTNGDLRLISCRNSSCSRLQRTMLDGDGDVGQGSSLVLRTNQQGKELPIVSYYDFGRDELKLAFCRNQRCSRTLIRPLTTP